MKKAPVEDGRYVDIKFVQEACGTAYLAIIKAIDEYLMKKGLSKKELPKSTEGYRKALQRYLTVYDGKLTREFERLYEELHIAGYYRGLLGHVNVVKETLKAAEIFIEKIS